jgi:hypothetical protein
MGDVARSIDEIIKPGFADLLNKQEHQRKNRYAYQPCSAGVIFIKSRRLAMSGSISQSATNNVTAVRRRVCR